jgi:hypothetical protein
VSLQHNLKVHSIPKSCYQITAGHRIPGIAAAGSGITSSVP